MQKICKKYLIFENIYLFIIIQNILSLRFTNSIRKPVLNEEKMTWKGELLDKMMRLRG